MRLLALRVFYFSRKFFTVSQRKLIFVSEMTLLLFSTFSEIFPPFSYDFLASISHSDDHFFLHKKISFLGCANTGND